MHCPLLPHNLAPTSGHDPGGVDRDGQDQDEAFSHFAPVAGKPYALLELQHGV
jgi:hypothetical protein